MQHSGYLLYPELSYQIVGAAFTVFNKCGYGMPEKYYQHCFSEELKKLHISHQREKYVMLKYGDVPLSKYFLDFIIDGKIVVEIKVRPHTGYIHIKQVTAYLKATQCPLAILIYFTRDGVKYRRIINTPNKLT